MKKFLLGFVAIALILTGCDNDQPENLPEQDVIDMSDFYLYTDADVEESSRLAANQKSCFTMVNLNRMLNENPNLYKRMYDIEKNTRKFLNSKKPDGKPGGGPGNGGGDGGGDPPPPTDYPTVTINVVVNILEDSSNPVSDQEVAAQIAVLNEDFNNNNSNTSQVPAEFAALVADAKITFNLVNTIRKPSTRSEWGTNDDMKKSSRGGIDPTDPANHMNIWVCNIGGGILGYAQFPGGSSATDGVVIGTDYFGNDPNGGVYAQGRTATHEVGHYLNLRHIWGDGRCRQDDFVADTPDSDGPNYQCPSYPTVNCKSADMTMNYMDYVYDNCMYMFSNGQNDRMRAVFEPGAPRFDLVN